MLTNDEITRLQSLSHGELLAEIGRAVLKHNQRGLEARPPSLRKILDEANEWLSVENDRIRQAICGNEKIREISTSESGATEKLLRVVADVVGGLVAYVPAGTVAEILVRDGIPNFCQTIWEKPESVQLLGSGGYFQALEVHGHCWQLAIVELL